MLKLTKVRCWHFCLNGECKAGARLMDDIQKKEKDVQQSWKVLRYLPGAVQFSDVSTGLARSPRRPHSSPGPPYTFLRFQISAWHIIPLTAWYSRNNFIFKHLSRQVLCMREMGFELERWRGEGLVPLELQLQRADGGGVPLCWWRGQNFRFVFQKIFFIFSYSSYKDSNITFHRSCL